MTHRLWLIVHDAPADGDALCNALKDLGLPRHVAGVERPRIGLRITGGQTALAAASRQDADEFINAYLMARPDKSVSAMSSLPADALDAADGTVFYYSGRAVRLERPAVGAPPFDADPYVRRLIRFRFAGTTSLDLRRSELIVCKEDDAITEDERLWLDPRPIELDEGPANAIAGGAELLLRDSGCFFLPPVCGRVGADDYFSPKRTAVRQALAPAMSLAEAGPDSPLAALLWRACNDPLLRDFIMDGARLDVTAENEQPTVVTLTLPDVDQVSPVARYRGELFLSPSQAPGPPWAKRLVQAVRDDLAGIVSCGSGDGDEPPAFDVKRGFDAPLTAGLPHLPPRRRVHTPQHGTWQWYEQLGKRIEDERIRHQFTDAVLAPTWAIDGYVPDHDLAERLFIAHYFRCPWSAGTDAGPWRDAMLELLRDFAQDQPGDAYTRFGGSQQTDGVRLYDDQRLGRLVLEHPPLPEAPAATRRLKYALLLPLGAVLRAGGRIVLDDPASVLDAGFTLA